jgi:hypothetical protein
MSWEKSYDNMLARGPQDDGFQSWSEDVIEEFSNEFWINNEDWIMESDTSNEWFNKLIHKSPQQAAQIIERAHSFYRLKNA